MRNTRLMATNVPRPAKFAAMELWQQALLCLISLLYMEITLCAQTTRPRPVHWSPKSGLWPMKSISRACSGSYQVTWPNFNDMESLHCFSNCHRGFGRSEQTKNLALGIYCYIQYRQRGVEPSSLLNIGRCRSSRNDVDQLGRNDCLSRSVEKDGELADHVACILGSVLRKSQCLQLQL